MNKKLLGLVGVTLVIGIAAAVYSLTRTIEQAYDFEDDPFDL